MITPAAVALCAFEFLGRSPATTAPIKFLHTPPPGVSRNAEAFSVREPATIYLIMSAPAFQDARRGRGEIGHIDGCKKLASVIVHEEWHIRHNDDEEGAYLAQTVALMQMKVRAEVVSQVRRSMELALKAARHRRIVPTMCIYGYGR